ncbi:MAG: Lrp/AsnC ligand binding domain-containing protein [Candidatus Korarchaeota archaeon]
MKVITLLKVGITHLEDAWNTLSKLNNLISISTTAGSYDMVLEFEVDSPEKLHDIFLKIDQISGIIDSESLLVLKELSPWGE